MIETASRLCYIAVVGALGFVVGSELLLRSLIPCVLLIAVLLVTPVLRRFQSINAHLKCKEQIEYAVQLTIAFVVTIFGGILITAARANGM